MVLSFAPDSCAGLLSALSWVVLIKLCCRTSERRLMDAQEVWQLSEDAGQSGPAAICSLSFTALLMEKQNQTTWIWALQTHTHARSHTHTHTLMAENTKHHFMWQRWEVCFVVLFPHVGCVFMCVCFFFPTFQQNKVGCEPRLWDLDERQPGWSVIKRYVLEAKQDLAFAETKPNQIKAKHGHCCGVCSQLVSRLKWNSVKEKWACVCAASLTCCFIHMYTQTLTNDGCAQWCLKHFIELSGL